MKKIKIFISPQILFFLLFFSCSDENLFTISQVNNGNFILFVSNQSSYMDPVDIKIFIDGKLAVKKDFFCKDGHNWIKFEFQLKEGNHVMFVSSSKGDIKKDTLFVLPATPYSVVDFWHYPKSTGSKEIKYFSIYFSEFSPGFM